VFSQTLVAVPGSRERLLEAFLQVWSDLELVEARGEFWTYRDVCQWCQPRSWYLGGDSAGDTKALYQDGRWAVLVDFSTQLADDGDELGFLSEVFGQVAVASVDGPRSATRFEVYERGYLRREILGERGRVATRGMPLPLEATLDMSRFYMAQLEHVWCSLGMRSFFEDPKGPFLGVHVVGRSEALGSGRKAWWKFW